MSALEEGDAFSLGDVVLPALLTLVALVAGFAFWFIKNARRGRPVLSSAAPLPTAKRSGCLLVGLCDVGKTRLFARLTLGEAGVGIATHASMTPNVGTLRRGSVVGLESDDGGSQSIALTDFPGHRRLRKDLLRHVAQAAVVVVVVDAVSIQDDKVAGVGAVAEVITELLRAREATGLKKMVVCCNKRDEITSYSAKSVRRLLAAEMARLLQSKMGDVAAVGKEAGTVSDAENPNFAFNAAGDQFDFDASGMPFEFVDTTAVVDPATTFGVKTLVDAIFSA